MTSSAIILCDPICPEDVAPGEVACVNRFDLIKVRKRFPDAVDLLGVPIEIDAGSIWRSIDDGLCAEAALRPAEMRWAPLALQRTFSRYVHYLQYKKRITHWLSTAKPAVLYLSSAWDPYLVLACQTYCERAHIPLHILNGEFTPYSGADPFSFAETLPPPQALDPLFVVKMNGILNRQLGSIIYEHYPNLSAEGFDAISFKWWRSIATRGYVVSKLIAALRPNVRGKSFADYGVNLNSNEIPALHAPSWNLFESDEALVLRSGLASFQRKFTNTHLDRIHRSLVVYLQHARPKRVVVLDPVVPSSRMLMFAARKSGVACDFLPHGLAAEDRTTSTDSDFSPSRILAWNDASARRYISRGCHSVPISHPRNRKSEQVRAASIKPIRDWTVLVLASAGYAHQIDAQDRDLIDVLKSLKELDVQHVDLKLHAASVNLAQLQQLGIKRLMESISFDVTVLNSRLDTKSLITNYDFLVINGRTTAIVEAAIARVPFVIFRGEMDRIGCLDDIRFTVANSSGELSRVLKEFDYAGHHESCQAFSRSLVGHPHPLDNCLN